MDLWNNNEPALRGINPSRAWESAQHYIILYKHTISIAEYRGRYMHGLKYRFVVTILDKLYGKYPISVITHEQFATGPSSIGLLVPGRRKHIGWGSDYTAENQFVKRVRSILREHCRIKMLVEIPVNLFEHSIDIAEADRWADIPTEK